MSVPKTFEQENGAKVTILVPTAAYCLVCDGDDAPMIAAQLDNLYRCRCDCGNEMTLSGEALRSGLTTSCGECEPAEDADR